MLLCEQDRVLREAIPSPAHLKTTLSRHGKGTSTPTPRSAQKEAAWRLRAMNRPAPRGAESRSRAPRLSRALAAPCPGSKLFPRALSQPEPLQMCCLLSIKVLPPFPTSFFVFFFFFFQLQQPGAEARSPPTLHQRFPWFHSKPQILKNGDTQKYEIVIANYRHKVNKLIDIYLFTRLQKMLITPHSLTS